MIVETIQLLNEPNLKTYHIKYDAVFSLKNNWKNIYELRYNSTHKGLSFGSY